MVEIFTSKVTYFSLYFLSLAYFPKLRYVKTFQHGSAQCTCAKLPNHIKASTAHKGISRVLELKECRQSKRA